MMNKSMIAFGAGESQKDPIKAERVVIMNTTKLPNGIEKRESDAWVEWRQDGQIHRLDGPALITQTKKYWYLFGVELTEYQHAQFAAAMSHDECLKPKYKVGDTVLETGTTSLTRFIIKEVVVGYRLDGRTEDLVWAEDELSPLPAHVHQFKCECGEKCDE